MRNNDLEQLDRYIGLLYKTKLSSEFLELATKIKKFSAELGKDKISVSFHEAMLIATLVQVRAPNVFWEIGSLTGYSALFILMAMPENGILYCFEKDPVLADYIKAWFGDRDLIAGIPELKNKKLNVIVGDAEENIKNKSWELKPDGIFIDANKSAYIKYLELFKKCSSNKHFILADNIFLSGSVWGEENSKFSPKQVEIMHLFNQSLVNDSHYKTAIIPTFEGLLCADRIG